MKSKLTHGVFDVCRALLQDYLQPGLYTLDLAPCLPLDMQEMLVNKPVKLDCILLTSLDCMLVNSLVLVMPGMKAKMENNSFVDSAVCIVVKCVKATLGCKMEMMDCTSMMMVSKMAKTGSNEVCSLGSMDCTLVLLAYSLEMKDCSSVLSMGTEVKKHHQNNLGSNANNSAMQEKIQAMLDCMMVTSANMEKLVNSLLNELDS